MTKSAFDDETRETIHAAFAVPTEAIVEARTKLAKAKVALDGEIEEAIKEIFGENCKRCSLGGYSKAAYEMALEALFECTETLKNAEMRIEDMMNGGFF